MHLLTRSPVPRLQPCSLFACSRRPFWPPRPDRSCRSPATSSMPISTPPSIALLATAAVTFTALEDLTAPIFELNNGLQMREGHGRQQEASRPSSLTNNSTVSPACPSITRNQHDLLPNTQASSQRRRGHQPGRRHQTLALRSKTPASLLCPGRWFPMVGSSPTASQPRCTSASPAMSAS